MKIIKQTDAKSINTLLPCVSSQAVFVNIYEKR